MVREKKIWLTRKQIREAGACSGFLRNFSRIFPKNKVEMTDANAEKYCKFFRDRVMWRPEKFLTPENVVILTNFSKAVREQFAINSWTRRDLASKNAVAMAEATAFVRLYRKERGGS